MQIGMMTFHASYNFGSVWQAFSLQYTVNSLGYNCEIINFFHNINNDKNYLAYGGEHISAKKENLLKQIAEKNIPDAILDLIQNAIEQY